MDKNFILTDDKKIAEEMMKLGFKLLSQNENQFTFQNCKRLAFSNLDLEKLYFTNILCI